MIIPLRSRKHFFSFRLCSSGPTLKKGKTRVLYGIVEDHTAVAVVGLGKQNLAVNENEEIDEHNEAIRCAAAGKCANIIFNQKSNHA